MHDLHFKGPAHIICWFLGWVDLSCFRKKEYFLEFVECQTPVTSSEKIRKENSEGYNSKQDQSVLNLAFRGDFSRCEISDWGKPKWLQAFSKFPKGFKIPENQG